MGKDVTLYADFTDGGEWSRNLLKRASAKPLTRPANPYQSIRLIKEMDEYDRILIHHHVEPLLAYQLSRSLSKKIAWYSGSIFEIPYSELLYGLDYKKVSVTLDQTTVSFYGKYLGNLGLLLYPASKAALRILDYKTVANYHKIMVNSEYQKKHIKSIYGRDSNVVYPPLENEVTYKRKIKTEKPYVMMAGAFVYYKNFEAGIRAMQEIKDEYSLVLVGSGMLQKRYEELAGKSGVSLQVHYGSSDDVMQDLYEGASFIIHPSLFEGFGFIAAEAALHQKPTILTTHSGVRDLFKEGESAYLCDPYDVALMKQRANYFAKYPDKALEMGKRAQERVVPLCGSTQSLRLWQELEDW
jgi:glycosyltransferase involved in cell wall biosynthesis